MSAEPYSQRRAPCGCRGVPDGQHLPGCAHSTTKPAPQCASCGRRARTEAGCCGICGAPREGNGEAPVCLLASAEELERPFGPGLENAESLEWLRAEQRSGIRVDLWDTHNNRPNGQSQLAYRLCVAAGERWEVIFAGEDFGSSPRHAIDAEETLAALLGFLSLRPGDTEAEYFERYTPRQLEFALERGEELALWSNDLEEPKGER